MRQRATTLNRAYLPSAAIPAFRNVRSCVPNQALVPILGSWRASTTALRFRRKLEKTNYLVTFCV